MVQKKKNKSKIRIITVLAFIILTFSIILILLFSELVSNYYFFFGVTIVASTFCMGLIKILSESMFNATDKQPQVNRNKSRNLNHEVSKKDEFKVMFFDYPRGGG